MGGELHEALMLHILPYLHVAVLGLICTGGFLGCPSQTEERLHLQGSSGMSCTSLEA